MPTVRVYDLPTRKRYVRVVANSACDVLVVGAGVSGLTTGICLAEDGLRVLIQADRAPQETTSSVAGAIWGPHLVEESERSARWGRETLAVLRELAGDPATGVRIVSGVEAQRPGAAVPDVQDKSDVLAGFRPCEPAELPPGFARGWRYSVPLARMPAYLAYLAARFERAGGKITTGTVASLTDAARACGADAVVNCTGTGAHALVPDPDLVPVRGQVVVTTNPGLTDFFIGHAEGDAELVYVLPHEDVVILGGTDATGDWSLTPYPQVAERIRHDCGQIDPRLRDARIIAHRVGLRPYRPTVRLEAAPPLGPGEPGIIHNYGHGGAGITLSWGCARDVARLLPQGTRG